MARQLVIELVGNSKKLTQALDDAEKKTKTFGQSITNAGKKMTTFVSVPVVGFLGAATKAAADDAAAQEKLAKTLENTTGANKDQIATVEDWLAKAMKASTFTDDELRPAFENLVRSTKDATLANGLLRQAMDIAAATGKPLEQVSLAIAKAHDGNVGALGRLGIATKDAEGKTVDFQTAMMNASETMRGQAAAALDTTAGKAAAMKRDMGELAESIGAQLLPVINSALGWFTKLTTWLDNSGIGADKLTIALLGIAAVGPVITVVDNLTTAVKTMNTALTANPLVGLAIAMGSAYAAAERLWGGFDGVSNAVTDLNNQVKTLKRTFEDFFDMMNKKSGQGLFGGGLFEGSPLKNLPLVGGFFKASGGPVAAGSPYVVGEQGPELFIPGASGTIVPNHAMGAAAGGTQVIQLVLDGQVLTEVVHNGLLAEQRRGGNLGFVGA